MEHSEYTVQTLHLISQPAFCVHGGFITGTNRAAQQRQLCVGTSIDSLLVTGKEEYAAYCGGTLSLTLRAADTTYRAYVVRIEDCDIFRLEPEEIPADLNALSLAAQALREPLSGLLTATDSIKADANSALQQQLGQINRGLFQLQRLVGNMASAGQYSSSMCTPRLETRNMRAVFNEIFEKVATVAQHTNRELHFTGLMQDVYSLADAELIEQAVYNLLSNAIKFSPEGGCITAKLSQRGNKLQLTVQDSGAGIDPALRSSVFNRYQRQPGIEDGRFGIGLGMTIVCATAHAHGGTVLMEQPEGEGARFTMTLAIRQSDGTNVRSPILSVDTSGGYSRELIAFSDILPPSVFEE